MGAWRYASRLSACRARAQQCCAPTRKGVLLTLLPLALLFELFDFALDQVALQHAQVLDEENAVEMVDFMAERAGEEVLAADFKGFTLGVLRFDRDELRAQDVAAEAWNGEAAFFFALFPFGMDDFRVGQNDFRFRIFPAGYVDHGDAQIHAD